MPPKRRLVGNPTTSGERIVSSTLQARECARRTRTGSLQLSVDVDPPEHSSEKGLCGIAPLQRASARLPLRCPTRLLGIRTPIHHSPGDQPIQALDPLGHLKAPTRIRTEPYALRERRAAADTIGA